MFKKTTFSQIIIFVMINLRPYKDLFYIIMIILFIQYRFGY